MAEFRGWEAKLRIEISSTMTDADNAKDVTLNLARSTIDNDTRGDGSWTGQKAGKGTWGVTFSITANSDDTVWAQIKTSFFANTSLNIEVRDTTSGAGVTGAVYVTDFTRDEPLDGMLVSNVTMIGSGTPTDV